MQFRLLTFAAVSFMLLYSCSSGSGGRGTVSFRTDVIESGDNSVFIQVAADGDWTLGLDFGGEAEWAQLQRVSGTGSSNSIILFCETNWSRASRSLTVTADFGGNTDSAVLTQLGAEETLEPDPEYPGLESDPLRTWMELPEMRSEDGCAWVYHDMRIGDRTVRNYSIFYDAANMLSRWVAYPLNKSLHGSGRNDQWGIYDPKIPQRYQVDLSRSWGSGYDRGHMIPVADRGTSAAKRMTYYPTNITAQVSRMNQGIWADLENKVRSIARGADTLYVVTGCIVEDSTKVAYDNEGKEVAVPVAYFKALLRYSRSGSTTGIGGYSAAGYYLEHRAYSQDSIDTSMLMSIDRLEELTGIDFFVNLASVLGSGYAAEVEAETPADRLWL